MGLNWKLSSGIRSVWILEWFMWVIEIRTSCLVMVLWFLVGGGRQICIVCEDMRKSLYRIFALPVTLICYGAINNWRSVARRPTVNCFVINLLTWYVTLVFCSNNKKKGSSIKQLEKLFHMGKMVSFFAFGDSWPSIHWNNCCRSPSLPPLLLTEQPFWNHYGLWHHATLHCIDRAITTIVTSSVASPLPFFYHSTATVKLLVL